MRKFGKLIIFSLRIDEDPDDVGSFSLLRYKFIQRIVKEISAKGFGGVCQNECVDLNICIITRDKRKLGVSLL